MVVRGELHTSLAMLIKKSCRLGIHVLCHALRLTWSIQSPHFKDRRGVPSGVYGESRELRHSRTKSYLSSPYSSHHAAFYCFPTSWTKNPSQECAEIILAAEPEANVLDDDFRTPLHLAAMQGHTDCATLLCKKGITVDAADQRGQTALHLAGW
jgi:hypothetical protein